MEEQKPIELIQPDQADQHADPDHPQSEDEHSEQEKGQGKEQEKEREKEPVEPIQPDQPLEMVKVALVLERPSSEGSHSPPP